MPAHPDHERPGAPLTLRRWLALAIALASACLAGAARTREATVRNAARDGADRVASSLGTSACTSEVLSQHELFGAALLDPGTPHCGWRRRWRPAPGVNRARRSRWPSCGIAPR
jgi:hypothetical protein